MISPNVFLVDGYPFNRFRTALLFAINQPLKPNWDVMNIWVCPVNTSATDPLRRNIACTFTREKDDDGFVYVAYKYIQGDSLEKWMNPISVVSPPTPGSRRAKLIRRIDHVGG